MGTNYYAVKVKPTTERAWHIGKSSAGWKFLFQTQTETWCDPPVVWRDYTELKGWLKEYVTEKKEFVILDEYDREVPFDAFIDLVEEKQKENNSRDFMYCDNRDGYRFSDNWFE